MLQQRATADGAVFKVLAMRLSCGAIDDIPVSRNGPFRKPEGTNGGAYATSGGAS